MSAPSRIAIASFAHMHVNSYIASLAAHPDAVIVGAWDDDVARGERICAGAGIPFVSNLDELLAEPLDGVIVTSENIHHRALTEKACMSTARAILCEKPIATTAQDGNAMIDAAANAGKTLGTAFPCRFSPPFQKALAAVQAGKVGKVIAIRSTNHGICPMDWFVDVDKSGGGAITDHTVHVADLQRLLLGCEATEVYAESGNNMYHQSWEDTGFLTVCYGDVFTTIDTSWSRPPKSSKNWGDVTMEIVGTGGVITIDMFAQAYMRYDEATGHASLNGWGSNLDAGMVDDFLRACRGEVTQWIASGTDGLRASEVAFAAYESIRTRRAVSI